MEVKEMEGLERNRTGVRAEGEEEGGSSRWLEGIKSGSSTHAQRSVRGSKPDREMRGQVSRDAGSGGAVFEPEPWVGDTRPENKDKRPYLGRAHHFRFNCGPGIFCRQLNRAVWSPHDDGSLQ